jgi:hypothetical protein
VRRHATLQLQLSISLSPMSLLSHHTASDFRIQLLMRILSLILHFAIPSFTATSSSKSNIHNCILIVKKQKALNLRLQNFPRLRNRIPYTASLSRIYLFLQISLQRMPFFFPTLVMVRWSVMQHRPYKHNPHGSEPIRHCSMSPRKKKRAPHYQLKQSRSQTLFHFILIFFSTDKV